MKSYCQLGYATNIAIQERSIEETVVSESVKESHMYVTYKVRNLILSIKKGSLVLVVYSVFKKSNVVSLVRSGKVLYPYLDTSIFVKK